MLEYAAPVKPIEVVDGVTLMIAECTPAFVWRNVNFWPRRLEVWTELLKTGAIETDTTGHGPGRDETP